MPDVDGFHESVDRLSSLVIYAITEQLNFSVIGLIFITVEHWTQYIVLNKHFGIKRPPPKKKPSKLRLIVHRIDEYQNYILI